jgi:hypothetical protein
MSAPLHLGVKPMFRSFLAAAAIALAASVVSAPASAEVPAFPAAFQVEDIATKTAPPSMSASAVRGRRSC